MIRPGESWGRPAAGPPDCEITGTDTDLAAAVGREAGPRVWFRPTESDLARAIGLVPGRTSPGPTELPVDVLREERHEGDRDGGRVVVNAAVIGCAPDRLRWWSRRFAASISIDGREVFAGATTTVVIANGQFLRGFDVVPRGHPGDGRLEVQVYALARSQRRLMRSRLAAGTHLPHPGISQWSGRRVEVQLRRGSAVMERDRVLGERGTAWTFRVDPAALPLLV